jgi:hypothetical protein
MAEIDLRGRATLTVKQEVKRGPIAGHIRKSRRPGPDGEPRSEVSLISVNRLPLSMVQNAAVKTRRSHVFFWLDQNPDVCALNSLP